MFEIIIIGGGTSGLAAACFTSNTGKVLLLEKHRVGSKLYMAGGGRVNLTNTMDIDQFPNYYGKNGDFLRDAFRAFSNKDLVKFINFLGLNTQTDSYGKIFLKNAKGIGLVKRLRSYILSKGVAIKENEPVLEIRKNNHFLVYTKYNIFSSKKVIIATGGLSYPKLGCTGDGYKFAKKFYHTITSLKPYEVPFCNKEKLFNNLTGITLKNVKIKFKNKSFMGDLLITHFGLSGPAVLDASCHVTDGDIILIDFLNQFKDNFLRDLNYASTLKSLLNSYFPKRFCDNMLSFAQLENKRIKEISKKQLNILIGILSNYKIEVKLCGFNRAFVTKGGIDIHEVNPKTMESLLLKNLFFCGEILDVNGSIGGFNIQAAFSTAFLAAKN